MDAYLKYLETEIVTYISLTQSKSHLVKGVAKRMLQVRLISWCGQRCCADFFDLEPKGKRPVLQYIDYVKVQIFRLQPAKSLKYKCG